MTLSLRDEPGRVGCGLAELAARVRHDLDCLDYPTQSWVRSRAHPSGLHVWDVVIVGGGQGGLAVAFGLIREKVSNILVIDENREGFEGPWATYARMVTLRTPKHLVGPDLGIPSLTFRAWWEAQHGLDAWGALDKILKEDWMSYLRWLRAVLELPVRNEVHLDLVEPANEGVFRLAVSGAAAPEQGVILARKVVLATGIQGGGEWHVPEFVAKALPDHLYGHTSQAIDYDALKGKSIGILGAGASAFDNAQYALRSGVREAHVFFRKTELPRINPIRFMENAGFMRHFADMNDEERYRGVGFFLDHSQPPTNDTYNRASAYPGFRLHAAEPWEEVMALDDGVRVMTARGSYDFSFLVISTGLLTDAALRPELRPLVDDIARWKDRYRPIGKSHPLVDEHPYLGPNFEFLPRGPEAAERLHGLFAFNYSALASLGLSASSLSGMKFAVPRLVAGITRQLFLDDRVEILGDFLAYRTEEFVGTWPAN